ncbi:MAG: hypothetical protein EAZ92_17035, partial [Candidatus Kapaibacterium sp.]
MELKISSYFSRKKLACAEAQCQYTMHLLNLNEAMICILQGTKVDLVRIPRNRDEGERLYVLARNFWDDYVVKRIEPPCEEPTEKAKGKKETPKNYVEQLFQLEKQRQRQRQRQGEVG